MHTRRLLIAPGLGLGLAALLIQGLAFASRNTATPVATSNPTVSPLSTVSTTLGSSQDNTLYEDAGGALSNGAGEYFFVGRTATNSIRRGVITFDIAGHIPPGSIIVSATLRLNMSKTITASEPVELHRLTASWGEGTSNALSGGGGLGTAATPGDATWIHRFYSSTLWTTPGGDFVVTASATTTVGSAGFYTWGTTAGMVTDIQAWLDTPATNFGWLLLGNETTTTTAKRFNTKENTDPTTRPALIVEYVPPYAIYLPIILKN